MTYVLGGVSGTASLTGSLGAAMEASVASIAFWIAEDGVDDCGFTILAAATGGF